ncbi:polysaccharide biosynthesis tyrosine autokinase [candidate division KSB1 bacterium]|nr:polysaccharide biosynthesis tyrosine autokinase [candidate division KSB1 bacterium]
MTTNQSQALDLNKILHIIFRRKWLILFCLIDVMLPIIIYNHHAMPVYEANTTIVFEEQRGPAASINPFKISLNKSFIINQIEEIKSRSLAEEVAKALPRSVINTFIFPEDTLHGFDKDRFISRQIQESISANSIPNSEVIKIEVKAYSPIAAEIIANTIADVLKKRNLEVRREETNNVRKIIEEQLGMFKRQLDEAEITLKLFKEQSKVTAIEQEAAEVLQRITEAENIYNQAKANLDAAEKRLSYIQNKLEKERKDLVPSVTKITSPWAQKLKQQLVDLEIQYTTLKVQNYADSHPKMRNLKRQIDQTKENLKEESLKIAAGENIVDPISQIQNFMEESIALEIEMQTYQAQEKALQEVIDNYNRKLSTLPDKELRLAQLLRNKEVNEKIYMMLLEKREEAKIAEAEKVGNIRIIDPAQIPRFPVEPRKALNLIVGFILGLSIGMGLAFLITFLDSSIKTSEEVEQLTNLSVLGTIPRIRSTPKKVSPAHYKFNGGRKTNELVSRLITETNPKSPEAEAFRTLRTNLQFSAFESPLKTILITSSSPNEGKSLITANLSIATAQMGLKTLLIDADLRKPVLHLLFQKRREPGLINLITTSKALKHQLPHRIARQPGDSIYQGYQFDETDESALSMEEELDAELRRIISATHVNNLDLLTCGVIPPNPSEILASETIKRILHELRSRYDAIIVDTPPINIVTDAGILSPLVDGSVLVVKIGGGSEKDIKRAKSLLQQARGKIIGVVINFIDGKDGYSNYYRYYYYDDSDGRKVKKRKKSENTNL